MNERKKRRIIKVSSSKKVEKIRNNKNEDKIGVCKFK